MLLDLTMSEEIFAFPRSLVQPVLLLSINPHCPGQFLQQQINMYRNMVFVAAGSPLLRQVLLTHHMQAFEWQRTILHVEYSDCTNIITTVILMTKRQLPCRLSCGT